MLGIELVERIIANDVKVICIDLTNQYENELSVFYPKEIEEKKLEDILNIGPKGKREIKKNVEEGGSKIQFAEAIEKDLEDFISGKLGYSLKIYSPAEFEVWRQDSKPYANDASMASLTPTEVTQIKQREY